MSEADSTSSPQELDIRSLSVTPAAKLLKVAPKTIRVHIRRGLPLVDPASPDGLRRAGGRTDLIVYGAWLNQASLPSGHGTPAVPGRSALASQEAEADLSRRSGAKPDGA
jgi:hypothetical protein